MKSSKKLSKKEIKDRILNRGVEDIVDHSHLEKALCGRKKLRVKFGIDPTGPKIHLGRAIPLRKLRAFQDLGHTAVLIIGDFTAQIGDASDKLSKRPMLTRETIKENLKNYKKQLGKIVDISKAEFHFNSSWLKKLNFQDICELAEVFTVQQMLARRNFKERYEKQEEISLREFMYPLMQGYDSVAIEADVELGGFDQLFNLKAGRVLQKYFDQKEQDIMTCQMLEGTDGRKMSTSWGNVITIVDEPEDMYGKIMSMRDELIGKYFLLCTDIDEATIVKNEKEMQSGVKNPRDIKMYLAREIVTIYHGEDAADKAEEAFKKIFQEREIPTNIPEFVIPAEGLQIIDILVQSKIVNSKNQARRLIEQGGVRIEDARVEDVYAILEIQKGDFVILQSGKRHFLKIVRR